MIREILLNLLKIKIMQYDKFKSVLFEREFVNLALDSVIIIPYSFIRFTIHECISSTLSISINKLINYKK